MHHLPEHKALINGGQQQSNNKQQQNHHCKNFTVVILLFKNQITAVAIRGLTHNLQDKSSP